MVLLALMMIFFFSSCNFLTTLPFSISFLAVCEKLMSRGKKNTVNRRNVWLKPSSGRMQTTEKVLQTNKYIHGSSVERVTRVLHSRNWSRRSLTETSSNEIVKLNFQNLGASSHKSRCLSQERRNLKVKRLDNENALLKQKIELLCKRIRRSNKNSS